MTYIDYLNDFNRFLEDDNPTDKVIVLYYALLNMFNRRGWPRWAGVDTQRLMAYSRTTTKTTALRARNALADAGLIEYRPGKKGKATEYRLLKYGCKFDTENGTESDTVTATVSDTKSATENATPNKTKTKTKTKTNPPKAPQPEEWGFGEALTDAFSQWLAYKQEKRQEYKPTGLKALVTQVKKHADQYGEAAVVDLIQTCMSANWQGIIWDRLKGKEPEKGCELYQYDPGENWEKWSL